MTSRGGAAAFCISRIRVAVAGEVSKGSQNSLRGVCCIVAALVNCKTQISNNSGVDYSRMIYDQGLIPLDNHKPRSNFDGAYWVCVVPINNCVESEKRLHDNRNILNNGQVDILSHWHDFIDLPPFAR